MGLEESQSSICETITNKGDAQASNTQSSTLFVVGPRRRRNHRKPGASYSNSKGKGEDLLFFEDLPEVLQFNRYVRSGYRAHLTSWECVKSIFTLHNEAVNIWSHLLPLLAWFVIVLSGIWQPWEESPGLFYLIIASTCCCLLGSVLYHTFIGCHCNYDCWLMLDVCGIYVVTLGFQWAIFDIGFACYPTFGAIFTAVYYSAGAMGVVCALKAKSAKERGMPLLLLCLLRFVALSTRPLFGGASMEAFWLYLTGELLSVVGGALNVARIPECFFQPGKPRKSAPFDLFGGSHQLMHLCVLVTMGLAQAGLGLDVVFFRTPEAICMA